VFGRTRTEKRVDAAGKVITRVRELPRDQWAVLICDHHPGYISWERYEANTARLRANWRPPRGQGGGPPRKGRALLQGLLRCGRCGRIMQTGYSGPAGASPRYVCARAKQLYAGERTCQSIGGIRLEQVILAELFKVLEPASLEATANALAESFFASLKGELTDNQAWPTRAGARRAIVDYIGWYNGTRLHSTLGYLTPAEFEASARKEALQQVA
jgi:integrase-like protein/recombinase-like zinc beta ribbon protein